MYGLTIEEVKNQLEKKEKSLAVVGLGFIGLPLSLAFASQDIDVKGYDVDETKTEKIKKQEPPIYEPGIRDKLKEAVEKDRFEVSNNPEILEEQEIILVTVGTPLKDDTYQPNLEYIKKASETIGEKLSEGNIVIMKSTIPPLTTEKEIVPILEEKSGLECNEDFGVVFCPERTVEGQAFEEFFTLPKIVGGTDKKATEAACGLFSILGGTIIPVSLPRVAEMAKLMDNVYRDINIAIANQFAKACNALDIDVMETIDAANEDYERNNILIPGPGVGGSCLNKDPYMLKSLIESKGEELELIETARNVNEDMPNFVTDLTEELFERNNLSLENSEILVLGMAFKKDTSDVRNTPVKDIADVLNDNGAILKLHDPYVEQEDFQKLFPYGERIENIEDGAKGVDCILLLTEHEMYESLNWKVIAENMDDQLILDARHRVNPTEIIDAGFDYEGVGRPRKFFDSVREANR